MSVEIALANLFEHLILEDDTWVVQIARPGAAQAPYVQGAAEDDGFVLEVSNNDILEPPLSVMQVAGLGMHGFAAPKGDLHPNFHRSFATLGEAREAAELLARVLLTVLLLSDDDTIAVELFASDLTDVLVSNPDLPLSL